MKFYCIFNQNLISVIYHDISMQEIVPSQQSYHAQIACDYSRYVIHRKMLRYVVMNTRTRMDVNLKFHLFNILTKNLDVCDKFITQLTNAHSV